ncbi:hypothetical protein GQ53DRAFT_747375 [Thozetella sp. PMI_491]|nr:hypothetical protein GQ53DRAFT_747375 [Thozetella sp. PMI_491]
MRFLIIWTALVTAATAKVAVMLPFYSYPTSPDWQAALDAIDAHQDLHFYVVINPHNGPTNRTGTGGTQTEPYGFNEDWVTELDKLNMRHNAQAIGYVATGQCTLAEPRTMAEMQSDIDNWATWSLTKTATGWNAPGYQYNISINGIFFDETAAQDTTTGGTVIGCYQQLTDYVNTKFKDPSRPAGLQSIVFNPGSVPADSMKNLFSFGDAVITAETCYTDRIYPDGECGAAGDTMISWNPFTADKMRMDQPPFLPIDKTLWPKSSILVHGFAQVGDSTKPVDAATLSDSIKSVIERGVHSLYFTTKGWASFTDPPADITTVVQDISTNAS